MFDFKGRLAVITGASRGIGKAAALGFASAGANVALIARSVGRDLVKEIEAKGVRCFAYPYDLSDCGGLEKLVERITEEAGDIDILYNNAGTQRRSPSAEFPVEDWDLVMDVNCKSVFFLCQAVGKRMLARGRGKIINTASLLSFQGGLFVPAYAGSKGAVMQFTKSLANEWSGRGVNVNCIAPGYIATELNTAILEDPVRYGQILERIPAGRWGKPEDITGAALFLASDASDYINGIVLPVDGGYLGR